MNNIIGHIFDSRQFTWSRTNRTLVSEVSSTPEILRQLWNDSLDLGFGIRSHKTGQVAFFTLQEQVKNRHQDTIKWVFTPSLDSLRKQPGLDGVTIHVFNT
jgi:hypothetical protein